MAKALGGTAIVLVGVLCVGCGSPPEGHRQARLNGTAGTSGRTERGVMTIPPAAEPRVFVSRDSEGMRLWNLIRQFYQKRGGTAAWIDGRKPRPQMDDLVQALQRADREGLEPELYNASLLSARRVEAGRGFLTMKGLDERGATNLDVWLTYLYLQYASDLANGVANPTHPEPNWQIPVKKYGPLDHL